MRCVHCNTTETPLWRAGPAGPKTLCNACGVRWKKTGSVIPRTKRPSTPPPSNSTTPQAIRKRARTTPPSETSSQPPSPPDPRAAAAVAAASNIPAPKPVSVFRVADAARPKYESVFSGLMVVPRAPKQEDELRVRTRTHTTKGGAFFAEVHTSPTLPTLPIPESPVPPCSSPSPVEGDGGVYVTEVHAPSPSPSPPPIPRVQKATEGGGFTLVMSVPKPN